jgi:hypothetical protein
MESLMQAWRSASAAGKLAPIDLAKGAASLRTTTWPAPAPHEIADDAEPALAVARLDLGRRRGVRRRVGHEQRHHAPARDIHLAVHPQRHAAVAHRLPRVAEQVGDDGEERVLFDGTARSICRSRSPGAGPSPSASTARIQRVRRPASRTVRWPEREEVAEARGVLLAQPAIQIAERGVVGLHEDSASRNVRASGPNVGSRSRGRSERPSPAAACSTRS